MNHILYLDKRRETNGVAPLRYAIRKGSETSYISLNVSIPVEFWSKEAKQVLAVPKGRWPDGAAIRSYIQTKVALYDSTLRELEAKGELHAMSAGEIKDKLLSTLYPKQEVKVCLCEGFRELQSCCQSLPQSYCRSAPWRTSRYRADWQYRRTQWLRQP